MVFQTEAVHRGGRRVSGGRVAVGAPGDLHVGLGVLRCSGVEVRPEAVEEDPDGESEDEDQGENEDQQEEAVGTLV